MAYKLRILGIDPSLNNFGMVLTHATVGGGNPIQVAIDIVEIDLVRTKTKHSDFDRAQQISKKFKSFVNRSDIVVAELPYGSRSARAAWTMGIVLGILAACEKRVVTVTPMQVKKVTGSKTASKEEVFEWVDSKFDVPWYADSKGNPYKYNNHIADALAVIMAGLHDKRKEVLNATTLLT